MESAADPVLLVLLVLLAFLVDRKGPPVRSCDSLGIFKLSGSDGAQESAIEVEQSQPSWALSIMIPGGQDEHLVAVHCDVAVHGDQVIVLTGQRGLRLLDLDGRFLRTIVIRQLRSPRAVAVSDGKAFVVDEDGYEEDEDSEEDGVDEGAAFSMS